MLFDGRPIREEYLVVDGGTLAGAGAHSYSEGDAPAARRAGPFHVRLTAERALSDDLLQRLGLRALAEEGSTRARSATSPAAPATSGRCATTSRRSGAGVLRPRVLVDVSDVTTGRPCSGTRRRCRCSSRRRRSSACPPRRRARDRARGRGGRDGHVPVDARDRDAGRGRRGRARRAALVPALLVQRRGVTRACVDRGRRAGFGAIVLTVDAARARAAGSATCAPASRSRTTSRPSPRARPTRGATPRRDARLRDRRDPHLARPRAAAPGWRAAAAREGHPDRRGRTARRRARRRGVVVSNHGGRQLDGVPASLDALPEVVEAVGGAHVLVDGGVRRHRHVLLASDLWPKRLELLKEIFPKSFEGGHALEQKQCRHGSRSESNPRGGRSVGRNVAGSRGERP